LIVGEKKFTAQIIAKGFSHVFVRRRVSPKQVYTILENALATDLGLTKVMPGDWVIRGEAGENYILNNEFSQRTRAQVCTRTQFVKT